MRSELIVAIVTLRSLQTKKSATSMFITLASPSFKENNDGYYFEHIGSIVTAFI